MVEAAPTRTSRSRLDHTRSPAEQLSDGQAERAGAASAGAVTALSGACVLSFAMLASGILAYAFHVLAARSLGVEVYGRVGVLWAVLFLVVVLLFRPLEQTSARAIADRRTRNDDVRTVVRSVALLCGVVSVLVALAIALSWGVLSDALFGGEDVFVAALLIGTCGYGVAYVTRGVVTGAGWFGLAALGIMADAVLRLVIGLPLIAVASAACAAAAIALAAFAGALAPLWRGRHQIRELLATRPGTVFRPARALLYAGPAAVVAGADQLLVNGGPLLVMLGGSSNADHAAGVVFAATMLVRIPVYVFQGTAASLLPNLTKLSAANDRVLFRRTIRRTCGVLAAVAGVIVLFAATIGPYAMSVLFGSDFQAGRGALTLLGLGVGFYLTAATVSQGLLALDQGPRAAIAWGTAAIVFVTAFVFVGGSDVARVAAAFALATGICAALALAGLLWRFERAQHIST